MEKVQFREKVHETTLHNSKWFFDDTLLNEISDFRFVFIYNSLDTSSHIFYDFCSSHSAHKLAKVKED